MENLLEVKNLRISFNTSEGILKAVRGVSFSLNKGETIALVGESGSGKSVTCRAIMQLLDNNSILSEGEILFHDKDILRLKESDLNRLRGAKIAYVYQDVQSTLNPLMVVGKQVQEAILKKEEHKRKDARRYLSHVKKIEKFGDKKQSTDKLIEILNKIDFDLKTFSYDKTCSIIKEFNKEFKKVIKNPLYDYSELFLYQHQFNSFSINYKKAVIEEIKQKELFDKYNVKSYYDLPLEERKTNNEYIVSPYNVYCKLKKEVNNCLLYLKNGFEMFSCDDKEKCEKLLNTKFTKKEAYDKVISLFKEVGITDAENRYNLHPFELSGGLRQRVMISIALASDPEILICDEITTSLDVTLQKQILDLLKRLKRNRNLSIIFISHDLGVVANIADKVFVMYAGKIVEKGTVYDIFYDPRHPYTWGLLGSVPTLESEGDLFYIKGNVPNMLIPSRGDNFANRNLYSLKQDFISMPEEIKISSTHYVSSFLVYEEASEVNKPIQIKNRIKHYVMNDGKNMPIYENKKNSILEECKNELNFRS